MYNEFQNAVKMVMASPAKVSIGTVASIDRSQMTCNVERVNRADVLAARLTALPGVGGFVVFPKLGSEVLLLEIEDNAEECLIIACSEIEKISIKTTEDLKKVLDDLLDEIMAMKFTTNMGPTIQQINQPKFKAIKSRIASIFTNGTE